MAAAFVNTVGFINLDPSVSSGVVAISAGSGKAIVLHIAVASATAQVASVTDDGSNVYSSVAAQANDQTYQINEYDANSVSKDNFIDGECWYTVGGGTTTKVTVTLTTGARFAVAAEVYTCGGGIGTTKAVAVTNSGAPSVSLTAAVATTSIISTGFSTVKGLQQAGGTGVTVVKNVSGAPNGNSGYTGVNVTVGNKASAGAGTTTVALAPVSSKSYSTSITDGSPNSGTLAVPATYVVCAVEIKA